MEFIKIEDLKLIISCAGEEVNNTDFDKLKKVYGKLKHICDLLTEKGFRYEIRQDPRKQAGPGKFVFQDYQWAKVYPSEFYNMASDKFAYIIGFSDTVHFHLMGIKDFQYQKASTEASKKCWTEVNFENKSYEFVIDEFLKFDKLYRPLFIETGFKLGISDFKKHFEKINIDKKIKLLEYKKQIILQGPPGTGKTREAELIAKEILGISDVAKLQNHEQYKIVQFHPSYTYEDFVRGIVAELNGDRIEYKNINKTIGKFAKVALDNFLDSKKDIGELSLEKWIEDQFNQFTDKISETLEQTKIPLSDNVDLVDLMDDAFLYIGENWKGYEHRMSFKDIKKAYLDNNLTRQDIVKNQNLSGSARQHATYYIVVLKKFREFLSGKSVPANQTKINEKKYILVIDEINRANLSSVLGELIYALEYRGKGLDSMYEVDGEQKIILPENLYIIGTMNTADRSVGHIDYAIRRRFAFVEVLPKELLDDEEIYFNTTDFNKVSALFNETNVSKEFEIDAVQIGHSYFIVKKEDAKDEAEKDDLFRIKMDYEIKPILLEYERDGILIGEYEGKKIREYIKSL